MKPWVLALFCACAPRAVAPRSPLTGCWPNGDGAVVVLIRGEQVAVARHADFPPDGVTEAKCWRLIRSLAGLP